MTAAQPVPRGTDWHSGTSLTWDIWQRLLTALDAGAAPYTACRYAGISQAVWERERQRIAEFGSRPTRSG